MENHRAEEEILTVKGLSVSFTQYDRGFGRKEIQAVTDLDLRIRSGEIVAVVGAVVFGLVFGVAGVMGLLVGGLSSGFVLAVFMANSGGAWDNAKKYIEQGHVGGKGSESHKAAVIGDTVGDPFKDTSGPSLNILIKLMSMVAIVTAGVNIAVTLF